MNPKLKKLQDTSKNNNIADSTVETPSTPAAGLLREQCYMYIYIYIPLQKAQ